jgi:hypothetical protein
LAGPLASWSQRLWRDLADGHRPVRGIPGLPSELIAGEAKRPLLRRRAPGEDRRPGPRDRVLRTGGAQCRARSGSPPSWRGCARNRPPTPSSTTSSPAATRTPRPAGGLRPVAGLRRRPHRRRPVLRHAPAWLLRQRPAAHLTGPQSDAGARPDATRHADARTTSCVTPRISGERQRPGPRGERPETSIHLAQGVLSPC